MRVLPFYFIEGLAVGLTVSFIATVHFTLGPFENDRRMVGEIDGLEFPHKTLEELQQPIKPMEFNATHVHQDDDTEAKRLSEKVRIFCWVMTSPDNHEKKAIHVKNTWGKRCNKLMFMSSQANNMLPSVALNISEGRKHLTGKTMMAFRLLFEKHMGEADWFMKSDDDTYVILENLRYFLSSEDPEDPIYFGHHFKTIKRPAGYFSGWGGYVVSKEAMRRFGRQANDSNLCRQDGGSEDAEFGKCMHNLGVKVGNSTDSLGRSRFHCFSPKRHLNGGYPAWYYTRDANGAKQGMESVSDYAITFHYLSPLEMYRLDNFLYHIRPYGIKTSDHHLNQKPLRV